MNKISQKATSLIICSLCLSLWSCENNRTVENTTEVTVEGSEPGDTARVIKTGKTAEERLAEMREWMSDKTSNDDSTSKRESTTRDEFKQRTAELDSKMDSLSERSKAEYQRLKERYSNWESRQQRRQQTPLQASQITQWQEVLLREFRDLKTVTPQNARESYLTFMGVVRAKRESWTQDDWDYVDHVYGKLNQRKREIDGQMSSGDKMKIKALQTEYLTLEGIADTRSMFNNVAD